MIVVLLLKLSGFQLSEGKKHMFKIKTNTFFVRYTQNLKSKSIIVETLRTSRKS